MRYKIEEHPFYNSLLKDAKRKLHYAEKEASRKDARSTAKNELYQARQELTGLISQLRHNGYDV